MKNILLVEDSLDATQSIKKRFERIYCVDRINKVKDAMVLFKKNEYDCIIIDLVIDPLGLTDEQVKKYYPFFGWAWLKEYLLGDENKAPDIKRKTIIFSQYVAELKEKWNDEVKSLESEGLIALQKNGKPSIEDLLNKINTIIQ